jgi:hypothetical protein
VPFDQGVQRRTQRGDIELAAQPDGVGVAVLGRVRGEPADKPQPLLRERQG